MIVHKIFQNYRLVINNKFDLDLRMIWLPRIGIISFHIIVENQCTTEGMGGTVKIFKKCAPNGNYKLFLIIF